MPVSPDGVETCACGRPGKGSGDNFQCCMACARARLMGHLVEHTVWCDKRHVVEAQTTLHTERSELMSLSETYRCVVGKEFFQAAPASEKIEYGYTYIVDGDTHEGMLLGTSLESMQDELVHLSLNRPDITNVEVYSRTLTKSPWAKVSKESLLEDLF